MWQETSFEKIVKFNHKQLTNTDSASGRTLLTVDSGSPRYKEWFNLEAVSVTQMAWSLGLKKPHLSKQNLQLAFPCEISL